MTWLDHKIPPPLVALLCAAVMTFLAEHSLAHYAAIASQSPLKVAVMFALVALAIAIVFAGVRAFKKARTTVNPLKPQTASSLVVHGVYRYTRNPMYVGIALLLTAWAIFLQGGVMFIGVLGFVLYIDRFQIVPEEHAMHALFGDEFERYKRSVRRWL